MLQEPHPLTALLSDSILAWRELEEKGLCSLALEGGLTLLNCGNASCFNKAAACNKLNARIN